MKNLELIGTRNLMVCTDNVILEYYLVEDYKESVQDKKLYGIQLNKSIGNVIEKEIIEAITYSKEITMKIISKLISNDVTPFGMVEVVDDLVTEYLCS